MTFGPHHYVPVLKVKENEKAALRALQPADQVRMTPLLEIVERAGQKTVSQHLDTAYSKLSTSVSGFARCFLDLRELHKDGQPAAVAAFARAVTEGIRFTPVTGVSRTHDVHAALANAGQGLALRLTCEELKTGKLSALVTQFLAKHGLTPEGVDLIVDLGPVENLVSFGVIALATEFLAAVPHVTAWRTLTLSGCAFPRSMGVVGTHSSLLVDRAEWIAWRDGFYVHRGTLVRLPTFSDCGIQHPSGVEGFDPKIMQVSAAARYATGDSWLLVKGQSTKSVPPSVQFPKIAASLITAPLSTYFAGAAHCDGCNSIVAAANGAPKLGSAGAWRRIGTIHHITTAVNDLGALIWP